MKKIFSKKSGQLLHIVHRVSDFNLDSRDLDKMANEIEAIVKSKQIKTIDQETWDNNTYQIRWNFILNKILSLVG